MLPGGCRASRAPERAMLAGGSDKIPLQMTQMPADLTRTWSLLVVLGVDSPFCSTIVLFKNQLFFQGFGWFYRKKDARKEWKRKVPLDDAATESLDCVSGHRRVKVVDKWRRHLSVILVC